MNYVREQLLDSLRKNAYTPGEVTLASGKKSDFYIDCRKVTLTPGGMWSVGRLFASGIEQFDPKITVAAGEGVGGIAILMPTTMLSQKIRQALVIRKEPKSHGAGAGIIVEGAAAVEPGSNVALVEDVVTSGGSVLKAAQHIKDAGFNVAVVVALVDRMEGGKEAIEAAGYRFMTLYTRKDFV